MEGRRWTVRLVEGRQQFDEQKATTTTTQLTVDQEICDLLEDTTCCEILDTVASVGQADTLISKTNEGRREMRESPVLG